LLQTTEKYTKNSQYSPRFQGVWRDLNVSCLTLRNISTYKEVDSNRQTTENLALKVIYYIKAFSTENDFPRKHSLPSTEHYLKINKFDMIQRVDIPTNMTIVL